MTKNKLGNQPYTEAVVIPPLSVFVGYGYLQHGRRKWSLFHRLRYPLYNIPSDVLLKEAIGFAYWGSPTAGETTGAGQDTAKVVEPHVQERDEVESEERVAVPEMVKYFISSGIH